MKNLNSILYSMLKGIQPKFRSTICRKGVGLNELFFKDSLASCVTSGKLPGLHDPHVQDIVFLATGQFWG